MANMIRRTYEKLLTKMPQTKHKIIRYTLNLTNSFTDEIIKTAKELIATEKPFNRGAEIVFYLEENIEEIKDRLYEAISILFNTNELRYLSDSDKQSRNYQLAYNKLKRYFYNEKSNNNNLALLSEEEILYILFNELDKNLNKVAGSIGLKIGKSNSNDNLLID